MSKTTQPKFCATFIILSAFTFSKPSIHIIKIFFLGSVVYLMLGGSSSPNSYIYIEGFEMCLITFVFI